MTATALKSSLLAGTGLVLAAFDYRVDAIPFVPLLLARVQSGHTLKHLLAAMGGLLFLGAQLRPPPGKPAYY